MQVSTFDADARLTTLRTTFSSEDVQADQTVPLYSVKHQHFGIIPESISTKLLNYYQHKGHMHLYEDAMRHRFQSQHLRHSRQTKQIDAHRVNVLSDGQVIKVYTSRQTERLRLKLLRDSDKPDTDRTANEAYDGTKATYVFLQNVFKTKSIDNKHFPLISNVHFDRNYCNAYWDGDEMVYGDGDGKIFNRFTKAIDVTAHEEGHGLTQEKAGTGISKDGSATGIDYDGEAGGINESYSDIIGISVKQYANKLTADKSDWLIGVGLILPTRDGRQYALRSMINPGKGFVDHPYLGTDSQVASYPDYQALAAKGTVDPHDSSGIPNKAYAVASQKIGGFAWDTIVKVWYETYPVVKPDETFQGLADKTVATAKKIFADQPKVAEAVIEGWRSVQVLK